jgi:UPF0716 family protein affecting phage T7 exclusion
VSRLLLFFIVVPAVELVLRIEIGRRIGTLTSLGLIVVTGELDTPGLTARLSGASCRGCRQRWGETASRMPRNRPNSSDALARSLEAWVGRQHSYYRRTFEGLPT